MNRKWTGRLIGKSKTNLIVWDIHTNQRVLELPTGSEISKLCAVSSTVVVTGTKDTIKVWDIHEKKLLRTMTLNQEQTIIAMLALLDGTIAIASKENVISIYDVNNGTFIRSLKKYPLKMIKTLSMTQLNDNSLVACDNDITVWDVQAGVITHTLPPNITSILSVTHTPSGYICYCRSDKAICVWNRSEKKPIVIERAFEGPICELAPLQDDIFVSGGSDGKIRLWNAVEHMCLNTINAGVIASKVYRFESNEISVVVTESERYLMKTFSTVTGEHIRSCQMDELYIIPLFGEESASCRKL
jgi:WD40 repeat protein